MFGCGARDWLARRQTRETDGSAEMMPRSRKACPEQELALLSRAAQWPDYPTFEGLTPDAVCQITRREGIDFATALLFDRLRKSRKHSAFIQEMDFLRE